MIWCENCQCDTLSIMASYDAGLAEFINCWDCGEVYSIDALVAKAQADGEDWDASYNAE